MEENFTVDYDHYGCRTAGDLLLFDLAITRLFAAILELDADGCAGETTFL
ncbi:MAG: hypothetical protein ACK2UK_14360 [Candidatus Promineifilaceae bacterium]|jgi:hypothetical protein